MDLHKTLGPKDKTYERYMIYLKPEYAYMPSTRTDLLECFLNRPINFNHFIQLNEKQTKKLRALFNRMLRYNETTDYGADIYKKTTLVEILVLVNSYYRTSSMVDPENQDDSYNKIKPIIQHIQENFSKDLSLNQIADKFFISKFYLCRLFKKSTGSTISEYIITCRIMKARELLKSGKPVKTVSKMVGFKSISHFIRTFKSSTGFSPGQYLKNSNNLTV
jgi:AraC-like DNA-binding protein